MNTTNLIPCACGCGGLIEPVSKQGKPRFFLPSHWSRTQPKKRTTIPCDYCGAPLSLTPYRMTLTKRHFCGQACEGAHASATGLRRGANNGHFNTITVPCAACGAAVSKAKSLIERRNNRVYCPNCIHLVRKGRKGFYVGYPPEFSAELRRKIRRRDNYQCQECGKHQRETGTLHVHHIDYTKHNNQEDNLVALCRVCHGLTNFGTDIWQVHFQRLAAKK